MPRRSKAYLASSCSCLTARGTAAAQTALPRAREPPSSSVLRRVSSRFSTYGARGMAPEGPTASLKRAVVPGHLPFAASESSFRSLSPKNPATDCDIRGAGRKVVRLRGGEGGTHFAPGLFFRSACRNANVHDGGGDWPLFLFLSLSFYRSLLVPTAIKNLPRDCLPPGATDSYHCVL